MLYNHGQETAIVKSIVIYTSGTMGDHLPFIALGQALRERGYRVRIAINQAMHSYAQGVGLEVFTLPEVEHGPEEARENAWSWDHWNYPNPIKHPKVQSFDIEMFFTQCQELVMLCREADLLIATSIRPMGVIIGKALGIPWLTVSMNPYTFWRPPDVEIRMRRRQSMLKEYDALSNLMLRTFKELGVQSTLPPFSLGWLFAREILLACSPHFYMPDLDQFQPRSNVSMTGFLFYQDPSWKNWQPDEELKSFFNVDEEQRPIVLAFSSQPLEDPRRILGMHAEAAARLGRRLVVQRGWADFKETDLTLDTMSSQMPDYYKAIDHQQVLFIDFMPHDWLFSHAACSVQHGGIGSIGRALRASCPLVIEPFGHDQLYNAQQVVELGVGVGLHPFMMKVDDLVNALRTVTTDHAIRKRVDTLGTKLREEDGLEATCRFIDAYLARVEVSSSQKHHKQVLPNKIQYKEAHMDEICAEEERKAIPHILHQIWNDRNVPQDMAVHQRTWQEKHPGWTYYLWTDTDKREFLRQHYPWFLPIYDGYPEHIKRVDAVTYFILHYYGGVYVDLDFECLRPVGLLLEGKQLVFGLEPKEHMSFPRVKERGFDKVVAHGFIGSIPGHPFWEHVFKQLITYHKAIGPLDATGPYMLTRAYDSYSNKQEISLEPPELLYPTNIRQIWSELAPGERDLIAKTAYAVHHWFGSWCVPADVAQKKQVKISFLIKGEQTNFSWVYVEDFLALLYQTGRLPRISCLMVTRNRANLAQAAVRGFQNQTYPEKELVILDDGQDVTLQHWVEELNDDRIVYHRLPDEGKTLGELRNLAVQHANGEYIAQWDDDDLSDPDRLAFQMSAIQVFKADACLLERHQIWWPGSQRMALSTRRIWESSFLCVRDKLSAYPALRQGEDTSVIEEIFIQGRIALLDFPQLYTYVFHGANTFQADHWEKHWQEATETYEGGIYEIKKHEMSERLKLDLAVWPGDTLSFKPLDEPDFPAIPLPSTETESLEGAGTSAGTTSRPKILILCPVMNAARFLPRLWENLKTLQYPHELISMAFLESDSYDSTYMLIEENLSTLRNEYNRVELFKHDFNYPVIDSHQDPAVEKLRKSTLARIRNYLIFKALMDEEWVLWIDARIARWPDDVIEQLLVVGKEIVAPNCLTLGSDQPFDLRTFRLKPGAEHLDWSPYIVEGILLPPVGFGRFYLNDLRSFNCVTLDGIGASMLLVRADLHREGLIFPPIPYNHYIESEGLAAMAREMGYRCWGLPNLEIFHPAD